MVTRKTRQTRFAPDGDAAKAVSDSAQKIWLAGLGAFERAKADGPKMFDVLVEQGKDLAQRARGAADQAMKGMREMMSEGPGTSARAGAAKRKVKRAASSVKRGATQRAGNAVRKTKTKARRAKAR